LEGLGAAFFASFRHFPGKGGTDMAGGNRRGECRDKRRRRLAPAIGLLFLAPWVGEFLLGSSPIQHLPAAVVLLLPLYGGGALLIREIARRTGRGYPAIVLLGAAYGVIEAGLLDQSMFNPAFAESPDGTDVPGPAFITAANNALGYVAGHAIWSITVPVAMTELLAREGTAAPWLGKFGLAATALLYVTGGAIVFSFIYGEYRFMAEPAQLAGAAAIAMLLVAASFAVRSNRDAPVRSTGKEAKPWMVGAGSFLASSVFVARPENGAGMVFGALLLVAAWFVVGHWSRASWWSVRHRAALVSGATLTCAWTGFMVTYLLWPGDRIAWLGNGLFALMAIALIVMMAKRAKRAEEADGTGERTD
jgi:hypothetical protein